MRSSARVIGWMPPRSPSRPGSEMSMVSEASRRSSSACSSTALRAASASARRSLTRFTSAPRAFFSSGGNEPSVFSAAVTMPLLPSRPTRNASSASSVSALSISASAATARLSRSSIDATLASPLPPLGRGLGEGRSCVNASSKRASMKFGASLGPSPQSSPPRGEEANAKSALPKQSGEKALAFSPLDSHHIVSGRRSSGQRGLRFFGDRAKRLDVVHGDVGQHLAVDRDAGLQQAVDQAAVGQAELTGRRIDTHDPQGMELALLLLAADVRVLASLDDGLVRYAENLAAGVVVALRAADDLLVT